MKANKIANPTKYPASESEILKLVKKYVKKRMAEISAMVKRIIRLKNTFV